MSNWNAIHRRNSPVSTISASAIAMALRMKLVDDLWNIGFWRTPSELSKRWVLECDDGECVADVGENDEKWWRVPEPFQHFLVLPVRLLAWLGSGRLGRRSDIVDEARVMHLSAVPIG